MTAIRPTLTAVVVCLQGVSAAGQWINQPTPGIPRTSEGRPNLTAPAPRAPDGKPDFSGVWRWNPGRYANDVTVDLAPGDVQPWAATLASQRQERLAKDDPANMECRPQGPRANLVPFNLAKIVQTPTLIVIFQEDMSFRQIFIDGRDLPPDPNPSWMGYSVGRWETDTLVVESAGFNDRTWLDFMGHPHTEALRVTERFRRSTVGRIEIEKRFKDPGAYARPWTITVAADLAADTDLLEYVCENERDRAHLVGTASDGIDANKVIEIAPEVLSRYVGSYEYRLPENPRAVRLLQVTTSGGQLFVEGNRLLVPLSVTTFALTRGAARIEFVEDGGGPVMELTVYRSQGCGGSSGVAAGYACGETAGTLTARRKQ